MDEPQQRTIYILAGPNGAGKTTFANSFLQSFAKCREFLNADLIAAGLSPFDPESQAVRASELLLKRIDELVATQSTFSFETTLAARSYYGSIIQWRRLGYRVILYFIWLPTPELAIQRVAKRVREGGHNIPETVVRRRYARGLANLLDLYIPIVDKTCVFDGASFPPIPIAEIDGEKEWVLDYNRWERIQLHRKDDCIVRTNPMIKSNAPDSLIAKANLAFEVACRIVIERARRSGTEIVIWRDGQIVELSPEEATAELESNLLERESMLPNNTK